MKKCIISLISLMVVVATSLALVGCSPEEYASVSNNIGANMPKVVPTKTIDASMSAYDMYLAALENYNTVPFVASYQTGDILTKVGLSTSQGLEIRKARKGDTYYMDNYTMTKKEILGINIKMMEEIVVAPDGVRYRVTEDCAPNKQGVLTANSWNDTVKYNSKDDLLAVLPNDPTRLFMYTVNDSTVTNATKPEFDKRAKQYSFTLTLDPTAGSLEYQEVVKAQLANNGFKNAKITFSKLEMTVTLWENGLFRSIEVSEAYKFKSSLSASASANALMNFTYDESEMPLEKLIRF